MAVTIPGIEIKARTGALQMQALLKTIKSSVMERHVDLLTWPALRSHAGMAKLTKGRRLAWLATLVGWLTPCRLVNSYIHCGTTKCIHLQGRATLPSITLLIQNAGKLRVITA
jgi:hypothetical protein